MRTKEVKLLTKKQLRKREKQDFTAKVLLCSNYLGRTLPTSLQLRDPELYEVLCQEHLDKDIGLETLVQRVYHSKSHGEVEWVEHNLGLLCLVFPMDGVFQGWRWSDLRRLVDRLAEQSHDPLLTLVAKYKEYTLEEIKELHEVISK